MLLIKLFNLFFNLFSSQILNNKLFTLFIRNVKVVKISKTFDSKYHWFLIVANNLVFNRHISGIGVSFYTPITTFEKIDLYF